MSNLCTGGGSDANASAQEFVTGFGYTWNDADPLASQYASVIAKNNPVAGTGFSNGWAALAEACMRTRAVLFCNSQPGDCAAPGESQANGAAGTLADIQLGGESATLGISAAALGAQIAGDTALVGTLGAVTAGVGLVLAPIITIFANHAAAEARQSNALCKLCPEVTSAISQIDAAVLTGKASVSQGLAALGSIQQQFKQATLTLTKRCNAFCGYNAVIQCLYDISSAFYQNALNPPAASVASSLDNALSGTGETFDPGMPGLFVPPVPSASSAGNGGLSIAQAIALQRQNTLPLATNTSETVNQQNLAQLAGAPVSFPAQTVTISGPVLVAVLVAIIFLFMGKR